MNGTPRGTQPTSADPPKGTRLAPEERRRRILSAAAKVFRDHDYESVSLDQLSAAAGVTRGLLHHYFGSKRELFLAVVQRQVTIPADLAVVPPDAGPDLAGTVHAAVEMWLQITEASGGLWSAAGASFQNDDLDRVLTTARDDLVERMIDQLPFPPELDRSLLRSALRCYAATARTATDEWLVNRTLSRSQTAALLETTLLTLVSAVVPAMTHAGGATPQTPPRANDGP